MQKLIDEIYKLFPLQWKNDFITDLKNNLNKYLEIVRKHTDDTDITNAINNFNDNITEVVSAYFNGCHSDAFSAFHDMMKSDSNPFNCIKTYRINTGDIFFRARLKETGKTFTFKDLFHIPQNKRGLVKTQRYSYPGYPCLYLGNTIYSCWEELLRPDFNSLMISAFKATREFHIYDLTMPDTEDFTEENLNITLLRLPLILSCSIAVNGHDNAFKPEYIIPQLLTEFIIHNNRRLHKTEKGPLDMIWGLIYTSVHANNDFPYGTDYLKNIVLPVIESDKNESYCNILASLFEVSTPSCYEYESLKTSPYKISWEEEAISDEERARVNYNKTSFGFMEDRLKNHADFNSFIYFYINSPEEITIPWDGSFTINVVSNTDWTIK